MAKANKYIRRRRFLLIILIAILVLFAVIIFKSCGNNDHAEQNDDTSTISRTGQSNEDDNSCVSTEFREPIDLNLDDSEADKTVDSSI